MASLIALAPAVFAGIVSGSIAGEVARHFPRPESELDAELDAAEPSPGELPVESPGELPVESPGDGSERPHSKDRSAPSDGADAVGVPPAHLDSSADLAEGGAAPKEGDELPPWWGCARCRARWGVVPSLPVVPWLVGRARCRSCAEPVPAARLAAEVVTGVIFAGAVWRLGLHPQIVAIGFLVAALVSISIVDVGHRIAPRQIVFAAYPPVAAALVAAALVEHRPSALASAAVGCVATFTFFFVVHIIVPRGMGYGDVRLSGLLGLVLGWTGYFVLLVGMIAAFAIGAISGLLLIAAFGRTRRSTIPFAPYLAIGTVIGILWGPALVHFWLHG